MLEIFDSVIVIASSEVPPLPSEPTWPWRKTLYANPNETTNKRPRIARERSRRLEIGLKLAGIKRVYLDLQTGHIVMCHCIKDRDSCCPGLNPETLTLNSCHHDK